MGSLRLDRQRVAVAGWVVLGLIDEVTRWLW
jgi:hypothetical protein